MEDLCTPCYSLLDYGAHHVFSPLLCSCGSERACAERRRHSKVRSCRLVSPSTISSFACMIHRRIHMIGRILLFRSLAARRLAQFSSVLQTAKTTLCTLVIRHRRICLQSSTSALLHTSPHHPCASATYALEVLDDHILI